ncbi:hypothetical protein CYMTET_14196, partial [Cymbomonas tetramitiformis]
MSTSKILQHYHLGRNPFTDRTAEKSNLTNDSYYIHSDLQGFEPNETTYLFFGKRGSGKTTIRMQLMAAYDKYNAESELGGRDKKPHFVVDLCRPGHVTSCLKSFQEYLGCGDESWDVRFSESWQSADLVDCILSYAATTLVEEVRKGPNSKRILDTLKSDDKVRKQFLLLAHLYANADYLTLSALRARLMPATSSLLLAATTAGGVLGACASFASMQFAADRHSAAVARLTSNALASLPEPMRKPRLALVAGVAVATSAVVVARRSAAAWSAKRAESLMEPIHVVPHKTTDIIEGVLNTLFASVDTHETIRANYIGVSGHQKMDLLQNLLTTIGYSSLGVFGDCFDE